MAGPQPWRSLLPLRAVSTAPCAPSPPHRAALPSLRYVGRPGLPGTHVNIQKRIEVHRLSHPAKLPKAQAELEKVGASQYGSRV